MRQLFSFFLFSVFWLVSIKHCCAWAEQMVATCIAVSSGDSCIIRRDDQNLMQIQLWGVEQIEEDVEMQDRAKKQLTDLIQNKPVTVNVITERNNGIGLAKVYAGDCYINSAMLLGGLLKTSPAHPDTELRKFEDEARLAGKGCWHRPPAVALSQTKVTVPCSLAEATPVSVTRVVDGDTMSIVTEDGTMTRICLYGCDAPEKGQEYERESSEALAEALEGKAIRVQLLDKDERLIKTARVYANGEYVNQRMLEKGHGQVPPSCRDDQLRQVEAKAIRSKIGLWIKAARVAPWAYRQIAAGRRADAQRRLLELQQRKAEERKHRDTFGHDSASSSGGGSIYVKGYYRKDGTYVRPHLRKRK